jgi:ribosome-interacting GTPase 1
MEVTKTDITVDDLIRAINQASYEDKKLIVKIEHLLMLKNEIEHLRNVVEAKNKIISAQKSQINSLTAKLINADLKSLDLYI